MQLKEFIFEQKCIPWRVYCVYCKVRNIVYDLNTSKNWDKIWAEKKVNMPAHLYYPETYDNILELIPANSKIADIGCGIGILLERIKKEKSCSVLGVDISEEAIRTLDEKGIKGIVAKIPPVPLPDGNLDVAVSTELLEHLRNPIKLLHELSRIIKPNGTIIISVPDNSMHPHSVREHLIIFNEERIRTLFSKIRELYLSEVYRVWDTTQQVWRLIVVARKLISEK